MIWQPWFLIYQLFRYFFFGDGWFLTSLVEVCLLTSAALLDEKSSQRPLTEEEKDSSRPENVPDIEIMAVRSIPLAQSYLFLPRSPVFHLRVPCS